MKLTAIGNNFILSCNANSQTAVIPVPSTVAVNTVRVFNEGPALAYVDIGTVATAADTPLAAGQTLLLNTGGTATSVCAFSAGVAPVHFTPVQFNYVN